MSGVERVDVAASAVPDTGPVVVMATVAMTTASVQRRQVVVRPRMCSPNG